ncbi:MAG: glycosyltransferase family 9 protein [bacterium]
MSRKIFNFEYFSMWREIPILFFLELMKRNKKVQKNGKILIVNPCLIGEFAASVPAIVDYVKRHENKKIDLLVTPQLQSVAQKISGIGHVYVTNSVYLGRNAKGVKYRDQKFSKYEKIIVLRVSELTYSITLDIESSEVKTAFRKMAGYVIHLIKNLILGRTPKRWSTLNFEILGGRERKFELEEMFDFSHDEKEQIEKMAIWSGEEKKLIVHVGTKWSMKRWMNDRWVELLKRINASGRYKIIFVGGNDDVADFEYISKRLGFEVESLINKIDLGELIQILNKADYFIGIDSGPSNLAHLVDLPSVTLYGPGPHMYMSIHKRDKKIDKTNGRGLHQLFFAVENSYIKKISVDEVYDNFLSLVSGR